MPHPQSAIELFVNGVLRVRPWQSVKCVMQRSAVVISFAELKFYDIESPEIRRRDTAYDAYVNRWWRFAWNLERPRCV